MNHEEALKLYFEDMERAIEAYQSNRLMDLIQKSDNLNLLKYTYLHRREVYRLGNELRIKESLLDSLWMHDIDKLIVYLFRDKQETQNIHRLLNRHHNRNETDKEVLVEMLLDWESARFTKPDKPLNAYDTMKKYYPDMETKMLPIMEELGLNHSTDMSESITMEEFMERANRIDITAIHKELAGILRYYLGASKKTFEW